MSVRTEEEYSQMKVVDLRRELKLRGLSTAGRKSVLVQRLVMMDKLAPSKPEVHEKTCEDLIVALSDEETPLPSPNEANVVNASAGLPAPWSPTLPAPSQPPRDDDFVSPASKLNMSSSGSSPKRNLFPAIVDSTTQTPVKTPQSSSGKKPRISFGSVEVRKYRVSHGGSLSTPSSGAYPIGLSWEVAGESVKPLYNHDDDESPAQTNASPRRFTEKERKKILEKVDHRSYFEKQASFETEKEELRLLRRARQNIGCACASIGAMCGTSQCMCYKEGLACTDDACACSAADCINPARYNFDQERVNRYRQQRIGEGAYTDLDNRHHHHHHPRHLDLEHNENSGPLPV